VPLTTLPPPLRHRPSRTTVGELVLGLLVGALGGWIAGLVRVRRP
jgi:hypothetical protein